MGEMADAILNGDFDEETGEYIGPGQGFPRSLARETRQKKARDIRPEYLASIQKILVNNGYTITVIKNLDYGVQMRTASGIVVNVYTSGKVVLQGKLDEKIKSLIK
jgi:hypothetical protein